MNISEFIGTGPHWLLVLEIGVPITLIFALFFVLYSPVYWLEQKKAPHWLAAIRDFFRRSPQRNDVEAWGGSS